jgi:hypothetical protein
MSLNLQMDSQNSDRLEAPNSRHHELVYCPKTGKRSMCLVLQLKPEEVAPGLQNDVRSRLLANHRMPAYRLRALTHIRAIPGLVGGQDSCTAYLVQDLLPRPVIHQAVASLHPLPPPPSSLATQNRFVTAYFLHLALSIATQYERNLSDSGNALQVSSADCWLLALHSSRKDVIDQHESLPP